MIFFIFIIINLVLLINFEKVKKIVNVFDHPDTERKFHDKKVFVGGGLIILFNFLLLNIYVLITNDLSGIIEFKNFDDFFTWIVAPLIIFLLGFYDDKKNLKAKVKFIVLSLIYIAVILINPSIIITELSFAGLSFNIYLGSTYSILFSYFALIVFSNAFNMMDGIDLQVGIYSILLFVFFILRTGIDYQIIIMIFSILVYLYLNFRHKTFLGDGGTYLLAYIFSIYFMKYYNEQKLFLCDEILILMILPGLELIRLFVSRILKKKNPLSPDRNHIHHLMIDRFKNMNIKIIPFLINFYFLLFSLIFFKIPNFSVIVIAIIFYFLTIIYLKRSID